MPEVHHVVEARAALLVVWDFVKAPSNWAPLLPGYQSYEQQDERQSRWVLKADLGPFTRVVDLQVRVTEWVEPSRVAFTVTSINEPFEGSGAFLAETRADALTRLTLDLQIRGTGLAAAMVEVLAPPVLNRMVKAFAERVVAAVEAR